MVIGCLIRKRITDSSDAKRSLLAACDDIIEVVDDSEREWKVPEWTLRQKYVDALIERGADWGVSIDTDEELSAPEILKQAIVGASSEENRVELVICHLWDDGCRLKMPPDGKYEYRCVAWRVKPGQRINEKHIHCMNHPNDIQGWGSAARIGPDRCVVMHSGYRTAEMRRRKLALWKSLDPDNKLFSCRYEAYLGM